VVSSIVHLQSWPGRGDPPFDHESEPVEAISARSWLVFVVAADADAQTEERFGLGAYLVLHGQSLTGAGLVVPDGHPATEALAAWCGARRTDTPSGARPWRLLGLSEFFEPFGGLFVRLTYCRMGWLVGCDVGRTLGLCAEHQTSARKRFTGGFTLWPPGWREDHKGKDGRVRPRSVSPHRPPLRVAGSTTTGYVTEWAPAPGGPGYGKRLPDDSPYIGRLFDVVSMAYVLDALETSELADHAEAFGLGRVELPAAVRIGEDGADALAEAAVATWHLGSILDEEGRRWLTSAEERAERTGRIDFHFTRWTGTEGRLVERSGGTRSPGSLAAHVVEGSGATPPLWKPGAPDDAALGRWIGAHHGGWLSAELAAAGLFPAVDIDIHSAYPAVFALLGCADLLFAEGFEYEDVTTDLLDLLARIARGEVDVLFDRATWERFGATLCEIEPDGEQWPVEAPDLDYPEGHAAMRLLRSTMPLPFTWSDVALVALRSGRIPRLHSAVRLFGTGRQSGLRARWPLYDGRWVRAGEDPVVALVHLRDKAKRAGDSRLAAQLRVVVNALAYGNFARIDQREVQKSRRKAVLVESSAPWTFPPIAATVTAGCRLLVGAAEHLIGQAGGTVAARDTDGLLVVGSRHGGAVALDDDQEVGAIPWGALDAILRRFDVLRPFGSARFWKAPLRQHEGRELHGLVLRVKRYVLFTLDERGELAEVVEATEHALGGQIVDPPRLAGRAADGRHRWTREVAAEAVRRAIARRRGEEPGVSPWSWDADGEERFPCIERLQVGSPDDLEELAGRLVLKPFGLYLRGNLHKTGIHLCTDAPVALDPGDLSGWAERTWRTKGGTMRVSTDSAAGTTAVILDTPDARADRWMVPHALPEASEVVIDDERLIRPVGRGGRLVEARAAGDFETPTEKLRAYYDGPDLRPVIVERVRAMGPAAFSDAFGVPLDTAESWASGRKVPRRATARRLLRMLGEQARPCALEECEHPVSRANAIYCTCPDHPPHRWIASKRRQRENRSHQPGDAQPGEERKRGAGNE
jgi:DNA-binding transcriptional regulator YiaG